MPIRTPSIRRGPGGILLLVALLLVACSSSTPATPTPLASLPTSTTASAPPSGGTVATTPSGNQVYTVTAEGRPVAVERFSDISYARITVSNAAHVSVGTAQPVSTFSISPRRLNV